LVTSAGSIPQELTNYFQQTLGLTTEEITQITNGTPVVKVIDTDDKSAVNVFGAIYIKVPVTNFVALYQDLSQLKNTAGILAINKFSNPPQLSDLDQFALTDEDVKDLSSCKLNDCEVQLPEAAIDDLRKDIDWGSPDAANKVNALFRQGIINGLKKYQAQGNSALSDYRDKSQPFLIAQQFQQLLSSTAGLLTYIPEFHNYLLSYPNATLENSQTYFYWETVKFGLKPTSRVNHVAIYQKPGSNIYAIGDKQLYATHYFETAIDLTFCVIDSTNPSGFYLITRKGSIQQGLTGVKGSIVRKVAVDRTQSSLKDGLMMFKQKLESGAK
jgi:hypothetical protein